MTEVKLFTIENCSHHILHIPRNLMLTISRVGMQASLALEPGVWTGALKMTMKNLVLQLPRAWWHRRRHGVSWIQCSWIPRCLTWAVKITYPNSLNMVQPKNLMLGVIKVLLRIQAKTLAISGLYVLYRSFQLMSHRWRPCTLRQSCSHLTTLTKNLLTTVTPKHASLLTT